MQPSEYPPRGADAPETAASTDLIFMPSEPEPDGYKRNLVAPSPNINAPLESLPPEIRRHLLSIMEPKALKSRFGSHISSILSTIPGGLEMGAMSISGANLP
ncbi:hypothetical protein N7501_010989 [Penicillium viridicatum]|nr:hypothetical protein N7501_010989 [Penicillium viridicatum]